MTSPHLVHCSDFFRPHFVCLRKQLLESPRAATQGLLGSVDCQATVGSVDERVEGLEAIVKVPEVGCTGLGGKEFCSRQS